MSSALAAARDLLLPPRCAGCDAPGTWWCVACDDGCDDTRLGAGVLGAGAFAGPLREAIHRFKYGGERALALELGGLVARRLAHDLATGLRCDAVVPVPLHRSRAAERGYDQADLLAGSVAEACGLPLVRAIGRIRQGRPQIALGRGERAANIAGAFVGCAGALRGLSIVLVDDVATTGATLAAATVAARAAGARRVSAYVVAIDE